MFNFKHRLAIALYCLGSSFSYAATESADLFPARTLLLGPDTQEIRLFNAGIGPMSWNSGLRGISLGTGSAVEFYLPTIRPGLYMVAVHCRTGHQPDDGGWQYCYPHIAYKVELDGKEVPMICSKAAPKMRLKGSGWCDFSGWIVGQDFVAIRPHQRVRITAQQPYTYVLELAIMTPPQAMAADWLVPDVMGKALESVEKIRVALVVSSEKARLLNGASLAPVITAFDDAVKNCRTQMDRWLAEFRQAKQTNDQGEISKLQKSAAALRRQTQQPLAWVARPAAEWCRSVAAKIETLPPVPAMDSYHARWARILHEWLQTYARDLKATSDNLSHIQTARALGRGLRALDLESRYLKEIAAAKPVVCPIATSQAMPPSQGERGRETPVQVCINGVWDFAAGNDPVQPPRTWETLRVPHGPWREAYGGFFNYGKSWNPDHHVGWYRTRFFVPADWRPEGAAVRFEAVFYYTEVFVNGVYCGNHLGGFERFTVDVSKAVRPGRINEMLVMVKDSFDTLVDQSRNSRENYSPSYIAVNDLWGVNFGGIWQDVYLDYHPARARIADVAISTPVRGGVRLKVAATVTGKDSQKLKLRFTVMDDGKAVETIVTGARHVEKEMSGAKLWGIGGIYGEPHLYRLHTELLDGDKVLDERYDPFGFSQLWIQGNKFILNGKPIFLAGGGIWYLQEQKSPLANRFFAQELYKYDRLANVNIERFHRHGDVTEQFYAEASEMGMLVEQEVNSTSFATAPEDLLGAGDFQDPVWRANIEDYYRHWAAKHRNYPCIGLSSIENETFSFNDNEEMMQTGLAMARIIEGADPLRLYDFHGNQVMAAHPGPKFINLHYVQGAHVPDYGKSAKGRPIINGEHNMGGQPLANNHDRTVAAKGEENLANFWRQEIGGFLKNHAAGLFVFIPAFQAYCTTSDWHKTTPWGEFFKDLSKFNPGDDRWSCNFSQWVDIPWPSLSGPDAKAEKLLVGDGRGTFNWFDPNRPVCTPNKVHAALKESFPKMPPCKATRTQEVLVTVISGGRPVPGATVILTPAAGQPVVTLGAVTDAAGTGWIVPRFPGSYKVVVITPSGMKKEVSIELGHYKLEKAGFEDALVRAIILTN